MGPLSLRLQLTTSDLERLAHAALHYLHSDQPDTLQQAGQACFRNLIDLDPDAMWLILEQLRSEGQQTTPPSPLLKPYIMLKCGEREKYLDNVNVLIKDTSIT